MTTEQQPSAEKRMRLRYAGTCRVCGLELPARADAIYERTTKTVRCVTCDPVATVVSAGTAGASARREHERRTARGRDRAAERFGALGGLAWRMSDERRRTDQWRRGAEGEERIGGMLEEINGVAVLHDRGIPGSRANIDHLVITSRQVWVIDPKRYAGRPERRVDGGIVRIRVEKLIVNKRDRTKLVDGALKQVGLVRGVVGDEVPVVGALCFVESDWSLFDVGGFTVNGVDVVYPRLLRKRLRNETDGPLDVEALRDQLGRVFLPN